MGGKYLLTSCSAVPGTSCISCVHVQASCCWLRVMLLRTLRTLRSISGRFHNVRGCASAHEEMRTCALCALVLRVIAKNMLYRRFIGNAAQSAQSAQITISTIQRLQRHTFDGAGPIGNVLLKTILIKPAGHRVHGCGCVAHATAPSLI